MLSHLRARTTLQATTLATSATVTSCSALASVLQRASWPSLGMAAAASAALACPPAASHSIRAMSSKSPRKRVQQHPRQAKVHAANAAAAAEAFERAAASHQSHEEAVREAAEAADAAEPEAYTDADADGWGVPEREKPKRETTLTLPSTLISSEQTPRRPPPKGPSSWDAAGRATLRTKLHPEGAIVGRGRIVANFGTRMLVQEVPWNEEAAAAAAAAEANGTAVTDESQPTEGVRFIALPRGKLGKMVCGDIVLWEWSSNHADSSAFVVEVLPRNSEFRRVDKVCAAAPATNATLLDRYLAAAQRMGVSASIVFNKMDLPSAAEQDHIFKDYEHIGVRVFRTSCAAGKVQGMEPLREHLARVGKGGKPGITIFVGQSGSGKSSILNTLSPSLQLAVNELSRKAQGRHTTTQTILHQLDAPGGEIIDSPGFQNYQPPPIPVKEVAEGFTEMREPAKFCHYGSRCLHINEPGCAVRLCLRSSSASLPPPRPASLSTAARDAPHTAEAADAARSEAAGDASRVAAAGGAPVPDEPGLPSTVTPEARFFAEFQRERLRQLTEGISDAEGADDDLGATGDPNDPAENALGETRNREAQGKGRKREWEAKKRREKERELQQLVRANTRIRSQAEAAALGEQAEQAAEGDDDAVPVTTAAPSNAPRDHAAERTLALAQDLAQRGLLDSVSTRRYQSYLQLVNQQRDIIKNKYA